MSRIRHVATFVVAMLVIGGCDTSARPGASPGQLPGDVSPSPGVAIAGPASAAPAPDLASIIEALQLRGAFSLATIRDDIDRRLAMPYFFVDLALLRCLRKVSPNVERRPRRNV